MSNEKKKYKYTQNRELSWLKFNERVLEEGEDKSVPLLERLSFTSIFISNLDEFFMIRVGSLWDLSIVEHEAIDSRSGMTPNEQLNKIYEEEDYTQECFDKALRYRNRIDQDMVTQTYNELMEYQKKILIDLK